jgi:hypothetical protein
LGIAFTATSAFVLSPPATTSDLRLALFNKIFEEDGPLGKGITVGKVQVALQCPNRSGIFKDLERISSRHSDTNSPRALSQLANEVCLALLRKSDDWTAACSSSLWFSQNQAGKAESLFNSWANREASKFEKEYIPSSDTEAGGPTLAVVSVVIEIQGDSTQ